MDRFHVGVTIQEESVPQAMYAFCAPRLLVGLGLTGGGTSWLRFGSRTAEMLFAPEPALAPDQLVLSPALADQLGLEGPISLTANRTAHREVTLGPLVGLLVSEAKLAAVVNGKRDTVYCRYERYAREAGITLVFFSPADVMPETGTVTGYTHQCDRAQGCSWMARRYPLPRVIYDRCFGREGRNAAQRVRRLAAELRLAVVNRLPKITKLQAFEALRRYPDLAPHLPFTALLTPELLVGALERYDDLYLKPDALYKGKGVYRLRGRQGGWVLQTRDEESNTEWFLPGPTDVDVALTRSLDPTAKYLVQEGLPLATYLGNRFDFRSLVQCDGAGEWVVSGLVARIAATGSVITSPRSGGEISPADRVLRHAFPDRWEEVLADLERVSLQLAKRVDIELGPCVELGLDIGVLQDGAVKLIEVNGKPLRVSLDRMKDPLVSERINRFPVHAAASMDLRGSSRATTPPSAERAPQVGVLVGDSPLRALHGPLEERYRQMVREATAAGAEVFFFEAAEVDLGDGMVGGWVEEEGQWAPRALPLPDVIYNRATYRDQAMGRQVRMLLRVLRTQHGVMLINNANAISKSQVYEALTFFPATAGLAPDTVRFTDADALSAMLLRHDRLFLKAEHGSHGSDVLQVSRSDWGWQVTGRAGGIRIVETFGAQSQLEAFLSMLIRGKDWILQQGIDLPAVDGRIFDLRAIAQKSGQGEWTVPLVLVRQARAGSVAANMSQGGQPYLPDDFLAQFGEQLAGLERMTATVATAAVQVAEVLESRFGMLGELGVDIGLDREGRPWVFEANTKPLHPQLPDLPEPLVRHPFRYAVWLVNRARQGQRTGLAHPVRMT